MAFTEKGVASTETVYYVIERGVYYVIEGEDDLY